MRNYKGLSELEKLLVENSELDHEDYLQGQANEERRHQEIVGLLTALIAAVEKTAIQPMENGKFTTYHYTKTPVETRERTSPKVIMVKDWLAANPDKAKLSNREIARLLDVTHPTVATARVKE